MTAGLAMPSPSAELSQEDRARADFYALISRLFHAGPDAQLLAAIASAGRTAAAGEGAAVPLLAAWQALAGAAAAADADAVRREYDQVFVGTGKAEITPYASHYLAESMRERILVRLRDALAEMGLAKHPSAAECEDHFSALCEVMRHLIAAGSSDIALQKQKKFFFDYVNSCYGGICAVMLGSPNTNFYKYVAGFTKAFLDVELDSLEMI